MKTPLWFDNLDRFMIRNMHAHGITLLRIALGIVFIWFGVLNVIGMSPVEDLIREAYSFLPQPAFIIFLGWWEIIVGVGLLTKKFLRVTLFLFWLQMLGTVSSPIFSPVLFFSDGNPLLLTADGEFVVKNLVLIAAGIVIGGFDVKKGKAA